MWNSQDLLEEDEYLCRCGCGEPQTEGLDGYNNLTCIEEDKNERAERLSDG